MAFLFVGPVPFIPIETKVFIIQGMACIAGVSYALIVVSSFARAHKAAMNLGYADDIDTYIALSGILIFLYFLENYHNVRFVLLFYNFLFVSLEHYYISLCRNMVDILLFGKFRWTYIIGHLS